MDKTKTIIKEIGIVLLLLLAVSLLLAIVFYDYIPNNKTVPVKIQAYDVPEDIKEELSEAGLNEQNIVRTYYIDSTDLDLYESTNDYDKGKANPFADYTTTASTNTTNSAGNTNSNNNNSANNGTTSNNQDSNSNNSQNGSRQNEVYMTTPGKNY